MVVKSGLTWIDHPCLPRIDHHITEYGFGKRQSKHSRNSTTHTYTINEYINN